ncbi:MAG: uroporphyrinogen decarboxylase, partial [Lachnospiraceae bacterium]|nr:uroporphyrinogen decarboxylase [Candidatus Equihabitans merdae]
MTGKELVLGTLRYEDVERVPWVPFAGIHAGSLLGYTATEMLTDVDKLSECLEEVHRLYQPDGQPVAFDLQLEAEQLGCDLMWADDNPPSVCSHPWEAADFTPETLDTLEGITNTGRIALVMEATRRLVAAHGEDTAIYGLFCGPLTLGSHMRGTKYFLDMKKNPEMIKKITAYCVKEAKKMVDWYIEAGADVIVPVDPVISQVSPKHFAAYMTEAYTEIFDYIRSKGKMSAFFVCGNATRNLEKMCETHPDSISVDENIPMTVAKGIADQYKVACGGNIPLTTTMLFGNQMDNMKFVVDMVDSVDTKGLIISPGCDMPYAVPAENGIAVAQAARNIDSTRELVANYETVDEDIEVDLPDYDNLPRP